MQGVQAALEEAAQHTGPRVVVPIAGASEDLQESIFLDADTVAQLAAAAKQAKAASVFAGVAAPGGGPGGKPARGQGAEVKKLKPVRPIIGASDALQAPKLVQVASAALEEL